MYCIKCGNEIPENAVICPSCNTPIKKKEEVIVNNSGQNAGRVNTNSTLSYDSGTKGIATLGLLLPPIGIVFYFLTKKDTPNRAKTALKGAIFGIVTYSLAAVIFIFFVLPIEKKYALKYQCVTNTPGSTYNYQTYTCTHPDGTEIQTIPK